MVNEYAGAPAQSTGDYGRSARALAPPASPYSILYPRDAEEKVGPSHEDRIRSLEMDLASQREQHAAFVDETVRRVRALEDAHGGVR
jgi:hypothetical protein